MLRKTLVLFAMILLCQLASATDTCMLISRRVYEKQGLAVLPVPGAVQGFLWQKTQALSGPFELQQFILFYKGIKVQNAMASVGFKGEKVLITAAFPRAINFDETLLPKAHSSLIWVWNDAENKYFLFETKKENEHSLKFTQFTKPQNNFTKDYRRFAGKDSWTFAKVFKPDPLSPYNLLYGNPLKDRSDSTYSAIESKMETVKLACKFENDSFRLQNQWLQFAEVSLPANVHARAKTSFDFTRNQQAFEEVNVFYHICELQKWWDTLGYGAWRDTVVMDVHAYSGADESGFNPLVHPGTIEFGDGGVDDAEDADAPVHEYTHAAFEAVIPGGYAGTQREGVEEGICDFMAVCYSRRITPNQPGWVYNWDGHNEFWNGRNLDNARVYPGSLTNQTHVDGQLFGGALYDLSNRIGIDSAVKITMAAMPFMVPGISMLKAAQIIFKADSLINNGNTAWPLIQAFYPKGLLPGASTHNLQTPAAIWVKNSAAFTSGGKAEIMGLKDETLWLLDASGKTLLQAQFQAGKGYTLNGADFLPGIYFLKTRRGAIKLLRN